MPFIVQAGSGLDFITAPAGYAARQDGTVYRDGTDCRRSSPEVGPRFMAYVFRTHRSAARQANKFSSSNILCVRPRPDAK